MRQVATHSRCHATAGLESLDYDAHESPEIMHFVEKQRAAINAGHAGVRFLGRGGIRWIIVALAGVSTGLVASAINAGLVALSLLENCLVNGIIEDGGGLGFTYLVFLAYRLGLASIAGSLVCFVEPLAAGSGIPEIKTFLNGVCMPRVLLVKTLLAKAIGIMFSVGAGLPCGKEGPMIHSGAICGSLTSYAFSGPLLRPINMDKEQRDLVAAGAAAGVSAAFSAPIGGVLFAIEEGATHMSVNIMLKTFVASASSALVVRFFTGGSETDKWGLLAANVPLDFGSLPNLTYEIWELPIFAVLGVLGGLLGGLYNALNLQLTLWRMRQIGSTGCRRFLEVLVLSSVIISLKFFIPVLMLQGVDKVPGTRLHTLWWGGESGAINAVYHEAMPASDMAVVGVVQFVIACWTYGAGFPSGLFVPILYLGAVLGKLFGAGLLAIGWLASDADTAKYALIGSVAVLAGIARITISLSVILLESVNNNQFGIPLFLTSLVAKWVGDVFNPGIYDVHLELKHIPLLEPTGGKHLDGILARDVMATDVLTLNPTETVQRLVDVLEDSEQAHNGFPVVVKSSGQFVGLIRRFELLHILHAGQRHAFAANRFGAQGDADKLEHPTCRSPQEDILATLSPEDFGKEVDLLPYTNQNVFTMQESASGQRCFLLLRTMGLRHLPILDADRKLRGIITRRDLLLAHDAEQEVGSDEDEDLDAENGSETSG
eukprot:TRINITY_DN4342_c0_g1_i3.p1 TRINITY_DN4342_c0_g1~~TRINITY_DN4342_c0_g1_i3.p1  ORF type:complete len:715 (-),score=132.07 TRINITY_DN4342_c0_g1_i3:60-2204(-)